jgi:hypothetical protein
LFYQLWFKIVNYFLHFILVFYSSFLVKIQTTPTSTSQTTNTTPTTSVHRKLFQMDMSSMGMNENTIDNNSTQLQHDYIDQINGRTGS